MKKCVPQFIRSQRRVPSVFFEDLLKQLEETIARLTTKIENSKDE